MKTSPPPGVITDPSAVASVPTLLDLCRDAELFPLARALVSNGIARLRVPGPRFFTYEICFGEEVIANDPEIASVLEILGNAIGNPKLTAKSRILPGLEAQETLVLPSAAQASLLREFACLAGQLAQATIEQDDCASEDRGAT